MLTRGKGVRPSTNLRMRIAFVFALGLGSATWLFCSPARCTFRPRHYMQALDLAQNEEYDDAITEYNEAIRLAPRDAVAYYGRTVVWEERKQLAKATADFNSALALDPDFCYAYYGRANVSVYKKELDMAAADYSESIRLTPTFLNAYYGRASVWLAKGEPDKAIADFNEILRVDPRQATAYNYRARTWLLKKEHKRAVADYTQAIALDGEMADAYNERARIWATSTDPSLLDAKGAIKSATRACELTRWQCAVLSGHPGRGICGVGRLPLGVGMAEQSQRAILRCTRQAGRRNATQALSK